MMGGECLVDGGLSQPFILSFMAGLCLPIVYIPLSFLLFFPETNPG